MFERDALDTRCRQAVEALSQREGWGLSQAQVDAYARGIIAAAPADVLEARLDLVIIAYHVDHELVAALRDRQSDFHPSAWEWVTYEVASAARVKHLDWSKDRSVDLDDLVQTVLIEVSRSIGSYHYGSSLRTWLYAVVVRRLQRYHRDRSAAKRDIPLVPLEAAAGELTTWGDVEGPIVASVLIAQICDILDATGEPRYAQLFLMRFVDGLSAEQIGARVSLHPSRVRAILRTARALLQQDEALRRWAAPDSSPEDGL